MKESFKNKAPKVPGKPHIYKFRGYWRVTLWDRRGRSLPLWHKAYIFKEQLQAREDTKS